MSTIRAFLADFLLLFLVPFGAAVGAGLLAYRLSGRPDVAEVTVFAGWTLAMLLMLAICDAIAQHQEYRDSRGLVLPYWRRRHRWEGGGR